MTRRGFTLTELLIALVLGGALLALVLDMNHRGMVNMESDARKMDAATRVQRTAARLRQELYGARWAWVVPLKDPFDAGDRPGSPLVYARWGGPLVEIAHDAERRTLTAGGETLGAPLSDVTFALDRPYLLRWALSADEHRDSTNGPASRERVTLAGALFLQNAAEDRRFERFVQAPDHPWCNGGEPIHYGFAELPPPPKQGADDAF